MCNLYSQTLPRDAVTRLFRVGGNRAAAFAPSPAIFPGHEAPVVRRAPDGEREIGLLSWGFVLPQPGRQRPDPTGEKPGVERSQHRSKEE